MKKKYEFDYVKQYYKNNNCKLLETEYINIHTKMNYICSCGNKSKSSFNTFKKGHRCFNCGVEKNKEKNKFSYNFVKNFFKKQNCVLLETKYINSQTKMNYICSCGNKAIIKFSKFKQGQRCPICRNKKVSEKNSKFLGSKTSNWNPNREEVNLNKRIRRSFSKNWIYKNMKDDPLFNDFLKNELNYRVDHIIPIKLFSKIIIKYNLNPDEIQPIANSRKNLQLLTISENYKKFSKGDIFQACQYLMLNHIKLI